MTATDKPADVSNSSEGHSTKSNDHSTQPIEKGETEMTITDTDRAFERIVDDSAVTVSLAHRRRGARREAVVIVRTREQFLDEVREGFAKYDDVDEAVEMFGWLWDIYQKHPNEYRALMADIYTRLGRHEEAARWTARIEDSP
jgi:hypothetical protein